jgi:hypothetical protein
VILPGYQESLLDDFDVEELTFDGADLVGLPGFWAAHLRAVVDDEDVLVEAWGQSAEDIRALYRRLTDTTAWPVFVLEVDGDARLVVVYRNDPDDPGTDYLLFPGGDRPGIPIAAVEGNPRGPGLSWTELSRLAGRRPDPVDRARTMLLLAPILGDEDAESPQAREQLAEALRTLGATGSLDALIEALVSENLFFGPAEWRAAGGLVVCDYEACPRNPADTFALKPEDLRTVSGLLGGSSDREGAGT